jgi:error-prone DNA polymerase
VSGAREKGVDDAVANEIFRQIAAFAEFGFCKSHAAAFALTAYHTAHLKLYYPAEFYVGLLNNQPMGFYSPAVIAGDAKRHGVAMLPVDVNASFAKAVVEGVADPSVLAIAASLSERDTRSDNSEPRSDTRLRDLSSSTPARPRDFSKTIAAHRKCRTHDVRLGFGSVKGLGEVEAKAVVDERERGGQFRSFDEFATRVGLKEEALRNLALVGAFDSFGEPRRALLWRARDAHRTSPSFIRRALSLPTTTAPTLPPLGEQERTALDYRITGIPTGPQIMSFYREDLARRGVLRACDLERRSHGSYVLIAGAVVVKQHPETAKGHVFLSLEDETGISNIIIRPATYRKYKRVLDSDAAVVVGGPLQKVDGVISVQAQRLDALQLFTKIAAREWQ